MIRSAPEPNGAESRYHGADADPFRHSDKTLLGSVLISSDVSVNFAHGRNRCPDDLLVSSLHYNEDLGSSMCALVPPAGATG
jgi:hypothetical protein